MDHKLYRLIALILIIGIALSGCSGAQPTVQTSTEAPQATEPPAEEPAAPEATEAPQATEQPQVTTAPAEPTPAEAKQIVVRVSATDNAGEATTLDPSIGTDQEVQIMWNAIYDQLMFKDSNFQMHPALAESWEPNDDATEWTFHLRKGVKFHDGKEFKAEDVVWTYQRLIDEDVDPDVESESAPTLSFLKPEGIIAVDDSTVKFVVDTPAPLLPIQIITKNTYIVPNGATHKTLHTTPVGTGPFIPENFEIAQQPHVFVKNPNYWEPGLPKADRLEIQGINEPTTRLAALQAGEIDIITLVDFSTIPALQDDPNVELLTTPASTSLMFAMWTQTPPLDDNRVRKALKMLVDRQAMIDIGFMGFGEIGDDNPIPPSWPYSYRKEVPPRDVEGAKALLAEAGYGPDNPLKLELYAYSGGMDMLTTAQLFQQQAADGGVFINLNLSDEAEFWDNVWLKQPFFVSGWNARHPSESLAVAYRCEAVWNETQWCNEEYEALLDKANATLDETERNQLYAQAAGMMTEEGGALIFGFMKTVAAMRTNCEGYTPHIQLHQFDARNIVCH